MKICQKHWHMCRESIDGRGMGHLGAQNGEAAFEDMKAELEGGEPPFDPLMSMNWHWSDAALKSGGHYLLLQNSGAEDGHYCPLCEFERHVEGFNAAEAIGNVADQMLEHCRVKGLVSVPHTLEGPPDA